MSSQLLISAVICTYNRADLLAKSLESLCSQTLSDEVYEIIVVNNASTDTTDDVVLQLREKYPSRNISLLHEAQQGLSYARNIAWQQSQADIVAYLDDDAIACSDWLEVILSNLVGEFVAVGGLVDVLYLSPKPTWFLDEYAMISRGNLAFRIPDNAYLPGGNMAWRKTILREFNGFDTDKGVKGDLLSLGEETWLMKAIRQKYPEASFLYLPQMRIYHYVHPQKMVLRYQLLRAWMAGQINAQEEIKAKNLSRSIRLKLAITKSLRLSYRLFQAFAHLSEFPHWKNWAMQYLRPLSIELGYILGLLNLSIEVKQR